MSFVPPFELRPRQSLESRFELIRPLGSGARSMVWHARCRASGEDVAVKALRGASRADAARLKREYQCLLRCAHPNVVEAKQLVEQWPELWFTMGRVDGPSITRWAASLATPWSPEAFARFVQVARGIVSALSAVHAAGRVHRDLKPENILVGPGDHAVLLDLDLSAPPDDSGGRILGTPGYQPPEQGLGLPIGYAADRYALGIVLYEVLTGHAPIGRGARASMRALRGRRIPDPRALRPELPEALAQCVQALMDPEPDRRPTLDEVDRALCGQEHFLAPGGEGSLSSLRSMAQQPGPWWHSVVGGTATARRAAIAGAFGGSSRFLAVRASPRAEVPLPLVGALVGALAERLQRWPLDARASLVARESAALVEAFPDFALVPELASFAPTGTRGRTIGTPSAAAKDALRGLVARWSNQEPAVVIIEDIHLADADSITFLEMLIDKELPIAWIVEGELEEDAALSRALRQLRARFSVARTERVLMVDTASTTTR